jgi:hypothetical protein
VLTRHGLPDQDALITLALHAVTETKLFVSHLACPTSHISHRLAFSNLVNQAMSSDAQADAPTRTLEGPRPVGASDTPPSSQQKQERISSTIEQSEEKVLHALRTFLVDKSLESSVSARSLHNKSLYLKFVE